MTAWVMIFNITILFQTLPIANSFAGDLKFMRVGPEAPSLKERQIS
jgi:hypothetical protein